MRSLSSHITNVCSITLSPIPCTCSPEAESSAPARRNWPSNWKSEAMTGSKQRSRNQPDFRSVAMIETQTQTVMKETDPYLEQFARFEQPGAGNQPQWVYAIRQGGMARFAELGFPTVHHE